MQTCQNWLAGAWVPNAAKAIIITSNTAPDDQYYNVKQQHPDTWAAYRRRITDEYDIQDANLWQDRRRITDEYDIQDANLWQEVNYGNAPVPISRPWP